MPWTAFISYYSCY